MLYKEKTYNMQSLENAHAFSAHLRTELEALSSRESSHKQGFEEECVACKLLQMQFDAVTQDVSVHRQRLAETSDDSQRLRTEVAAMCEGALGYKHTLREERVAMERLETDNEAMRQASVECLSNLENERELSIDLREKFGVVEQEELGIAQCLQRRAEAVSRETVAHLFSLESEREVSMRLQEQLEAVEQDSLSHQRRAQGEHDAAQQLQRELVAAQQAELETAQRGSSHDVLRSEREIIALDRLKVEYEAMRQECANHLLGFESEYEAFMQLQIDLEAAGRDNCRHEQRAHSESESCKSWQRELEAVHQYLADERARSSDMQRSLEATRSDLASCRESLARERDMCRDLRRKLDAAALDGLGNRRNLQQWRGDCDGSQREFMAAQQDFAQERTSFSDMRVSAEPDESARCTPSLEQEAVPAFGWHNGEIAARVDVGRLGAWSRPLSPLLPPSMLEARRREPRGASLRLETQLAPEETDEASSCPRASCSSECSQVPLRAPSVSREGVALPPRSPPCGADAAVQEAGATRRATWSKWCDEADKQADKQDVAALQPGGCHGAPASAASPPGAALQPRDLPRPGTIALGCLFPSEGTPASFVTAKDCCEDAPPWATPSPPCGGGDRGSILWGCSPPPAAPRALAGEPWKARAAGAGLPSMNNPTQQNKIFASAWLGRQVGDGDAAGGGAPQKAAAAASAANGWAAFRGPTEEAVSLSVSSSPRQLSWSPRVLLQPPRPAS